MKMSKDNNEELKFTLKVPTTHKKERISDKIIKVDELEENAKQKRKKTVATPVSADYIQESYKDIVEGSGIICTTPEEFLVKFNDSRKHTKVILEYKGKAIYKIIKMIGMSKKSQLKLHSELVKALVKARSVL